VEYDEDSLLIYTDVFVMFYEAVIGSCIALQSGGGISGHIHKALATLRPRRSFVRQPVNRGGCSRTLDLRGHKVARAL
jgi:hypothetical protein